MKDLPRLIAHRGLMARFPENTRLGLHEAIAAGAAWVEFDVQLSADGLPVVFHDETLERTTARSGSLLELPAREILAISAHEPQRFGERYRGETIPALAAVIELLNAHPGVQAFVELKRHSLVRHGTETVLRAVLGELKAAIFPWVIISFEAEALDVARRLGVARVGWVLRTYDAPARRCARSLAPQFLFCNWTRLPHPDTALWPGPWDWVIYDTVEPALARRLQQAGAAYIETADVAALAGALAHG